jgi:hypothetical protein
MREKLLNVRRHGVARIRLLSRESLSWRSGLVANNP